MTMIPTFASMVKLLENYTFQIHDIIKQYLTGRDRRTGSNTDSKQFVDPLSRLGKIFIEKKGQYQIEISKQGVRILDNSSATYTNTTYTLTNNSDFVIGSIYVAIESRVEPLVYVSTEAFEFSIAVKQRKHSLKFYVDRLPRRKNYGGLLGFGLSHSYQVQNLVHAILKPAS